MRHILRLFVVALVFSFMGVANAAGIPVVVDPYGYPEVWTQEVYNGSGSDIASAVIVRWDCEASTGTYVINGMAMWVEIIDTAADVRTAGVVPLNQGITKGNSGTIIIRGPALVKNGGTATAGEIVESDNAGLVVDYTSAGGVEEAVIGWSIIDTAEEAYPGLGTGYSIIFIDPTLVIDHS